MEWYCGTGLRPYLDQLDEKKKSEEALAQKLRDEQSQKAKLLEEQKRLEFPHKYIVDLSQKLWDIKNDLLNRH